jgi:type IV fimbrial biogenesis protein FimT
MMKHLTKSNRVSGFTLLELIVTLTVASVLLSVGIPSFRAVTMNSRMIAQTNELVTSIKMARSAAVRYQRNATVCLSTDYDAATPSCAAGTDWSTGWIVWVDKDRDTVTDADEILQVHEPVTGTSTLSSTATNQFSFNARGFALVGGDDLTLCDDRSGETGRLIRVNNTGRTSVVETACM